MTDYSKKQLADILSALDGQTRNPASKAEALAAIERHAAEIGCTLDDVFAAGDMWINGRSGGGEFHAELRARAAAAEGQDPAEDDAVEAGEAEAVEIDDEPAAEAVEEVDPVETGDDGTVHIDELHTSDHPTAIENAESWPTEPVKAPTVRDLLLAACRQAATVLAKYDIEAETQQVLRDAIDRAVGRGSAAQARKERAAQAAQARQERASRPASQGPREGTKEAMVIEMLRSDNGATIAEIAEATGWLQHTVRGFFAAALKKRRGLVVSSEKSLDAGAPRVYRLDA